MDKVLIKNQHEELADLILEADKLIARLSRLSKKEEIKDKTLDKLSYTRGLKSRVNHMMKKNTDLSLTRANALFDDFVNKASDFINTSKVLTKSPSLKIDFKKEGKLDYFAKDLSIRMAGVDLDRLIKDLKRIKNALYLEMKRINRQIEQIEIKDKFQEIKDSINNI
ncbi:MAG: hypothetical protein Q4E50_03065 [Tissierellia bacterium]|nr:hypothetical protein [Tissierellia bacterium]